MRPDPTVGTGIIILEVLTDGGGATTVRADPLRPVAQFTHGIAQVVQIGELLVQARQALIKQVDDMPTGRGAVVADLQDLADLGQGQAGGLAAADEVDLGERVGGVVVIPLAVGAAVGCRE